MFAQSTQMAGARVACASIWTPILSNDVASESKVHGRFHESPQFRRAVDLLESANGSPIPSDCCEEMRLRNLKAKKFSTDGFQLSNFLNPRPASDLAKGRECLY